MILCLFLLLSKTDSHMSMVYDVPSLLHKTYGIWDMSAQGTFYWTKINGICIRMDKRVTFMHCNDMLGWFRLCMKYCSILCYTVLCYVFQVCFMLYYVSVRNRCDRLYPFSKQIDIALGKKFFPAPRWYLNNADLLGSGFFKIRSIE